MESVEALPVDRATSDERAKDKVTQADSPMAEFMDNLHPKAFNYVHGTPGEDPNHRYAGVMAQSVERSPVGKTIVEDTPDGKQLDIRHGFGTALAALGNLNQRMRQLEGVKRK